MVKKVIIQKFFFCQNLSKTFLKKLVYLIFNFLPKSSKKTERRPMKLLKCNKIFQHSTVSSKWYQERKNSTKLDYTFQCIVFTLFNKWKGIFLRVDSFVFESRISNILKKISTISASYFFKIKIQLVMFSHCFVLVNCKD